MLNHNSPSRQQEFPSERPSDIGNSKGNDRTSESVGLRFAKWVMNCISGLMGISIIWFVILDSRSSYVPSWHVTPAAGPSRMPGTSSGRGNASSQHGILSSAYWSKAVVPLHRFRFEPPLASEEPAGQYYERRYDDFRNAVTAARNVSTFGVDPDLIAMAQGHLQQDERELHLYQAVQDFASQQKLAKNTLPLNDNEQLAQAIFAQLTEEEFNRLPAEVQQMLTELVELLETKVDQLHEIEIMQARLSERYRGHSFALPELRDGT